MNVINSMIVKLNQTPLIPNILAIVITINKGKIYPRKITNEIETYELLIAEKKILNTIFKLEKTRLNNKIFIPNIVISPTVLFTEALKKLIINCGLRQTNAKQINAKHSAAINPNLRLKRILLKVRFVY